MTNHPLKTWRKTQKLTQAAAGELIGINRWFVNRIECGDRMPSFETAEAIYNVTGGVVTPNDLLFFKQRGAANEGNDITRI